MLLKENYSIPKLRIPGLKLVDVLMFEAFQIVSDLGNGASCTCIWFCQHPIYWTVSGNDSVQN